MTSQVYDFKFREVAKILGAPVAIVAALAGILHGGAAVQWLPLPRPALDIDRTILIHQAERARIAGPADVVLLGDSSCLMDIDAAILSRLLQRRVLNLGTLSYLDLTSIVELWQTYRRQRGAAVEALVLVLHPEFLRRNEAVPFHVNTLKHYFDGTDYCPPVDAARRLECGLGLAILRGRILSRALPLPLQGSFRQAYGFNHDLERYMDRHNGSLADPRTFNEQINVGNTEYRISPALRREVSAQSSAMLEAPLVIVALTPTPESLAGPLFESRYHALLTEWSKLVSADTSLTRLPGTLPDARFATKTHLTGPAARTFTTSIADSLKSLIGPHHSQ